jgi:hypothetical protein
MAEIANVSSTTKDAPADAPLAPRRRRRRWPFVVLILLVLAALAAGLAWVGLGTLKASRVVQERASTAQAELGQFRSTLQAGDSTAARGHLTAGAAALDEATDAAAATEVRVARHIPYVGRTVRDLDHLLAAATTMSGAGGNALTVYEEFSGEDSKLFANNTFSIPALRRAGAALTSLTTALDSAEAELQQVTGTGPRGAQALEKKQAALEQVASLRKQTAGLMPLVQALPSAVGAEAPKSYLVTVLNPAESRASGGAPLSVAFLHLNEGKLTIPVQGQTSLLTGNKPHVYTAVGGDPWVKGRTGHRFVNANFNPDFSIAGEQLARASAQLRQKPDGVIALDVQAIGMLLKATGPIQSPDYGELNAENAAQKLVVDVYLAPQDQAARHEENDQLMGTMLQRLTEGGGLLGKARALGEAIPGRHLQMYFRDPALQQIVTRAKAGGLVTPPAVGDLAAAYTQNVNASKVDTYQHRTLQQTYTLKADGSATVRRTVVIENRTPPYQGGGEDPKTGYYTRWALLRVMNLMPPGSVITRVPRVEDGPGFKGGTAQRKGSDGQGRVYSDAIAEVEPGGRARLTWEYRLPKAAVRDGDGLRLQIQAETQPLLNPPKLQVGVIPPKGWVAEVGPGWTKTDAGATASMTLDQSRLLQLKVAPAS